MTVVSRIVAAQNTRRASFSERRRPSTLNLEAEAALRMNVHRSANGFFISGGAAFRAAVALDFAKNLVGLMLEYC